MTVNRIFTAANLLLLAAASYFGVSLFYSVLVARLDAGLPPAAAGAQRSAPDVDAPGSAADYQVIVERNLFNSGRQAVAKADPVLDVDKLKPTDAKIRLIGTTAERDGHLYAVIEDAKTREHVMYRPGDPIQNVQNAVIKMILRTKVVLTVNGRDEVLLQEDLGASPRPQSSSPARADVRPVEPAQQVVLKEDQVQSAMENIGDLLNQATFRPHIEDGRPAGISITGIKPNAIFRKLRLRNGDIITGVNGTTIASMEDAVRVMSSLSPENPVQVKVKRRGQEETLEYRTE
jgi:general secretion pathway protein C